MRTPDDPFAEAYGNISHMTPGTRVLNIAASYMPVLRKLPFPRVVEINEARKSISRRATQLVRERQAQTISRKDILNIMIEENRKSRGTLSETEVVDQIMTFLLAGHETTSVAVALRRCSL